MKVPGYTIVRELGRGGMATVYLARQDRLTRDVALKVMKPIAMAGDDFTSRFVKEGQIIAQLQHPQIVTIYDFDSNDGYHYFSMEYLPGGTLADEIKRGLPVSRAIAITHKVAEALAVAHARGVIHRDVKPQNILFRSDGTPVLTDFGIARAVTRDADSIQLTSHGMVIGSPRYMSPEQSTGQPLDPRSDLYSLGVVFYEMLTQHLPYEADDVVSLAMKHCNDPIPRLPEALAIYQPILDRLIAKKPEERFASAGQLIRALESLRSDTLASTTSDDATRLIARSGERRQVSAASPEVRESTPEIRPEPPQRWRWLVALGIVLIAALGTYIGIDHHGAKPHTLAIANQLPAPAPNRPETVVQYEQLAIEHFEHHQFEQSLEITRLGLAITPHDARLKTLKTLNQHQIQAKQLLDQARTALAENRLDDSLESVKHGLTLVPDHPDLKALESEIEQRLEQRRQITANRLLKQAQAAQSRGALEEAMRLTRKGLDQVPDHFGLLSLRDSLAAALKQEQDIASILQRIDALLNADKLPEAETAIQSALASHPDEPRILKRRDTLEHLRTVKKEARVNQLYEQAIARYDEANYPQSMKLIEAGLALDPTHAGLRSLRDKVAAAQSEEQQRQAEEHLHRAQALFDTGDLDGSLALVTKGLGIAPEHVGLKALRARILAQQEQTRKVAEQLRDCNSRFPRADSSPANSLDAHACFAQVLTLDPTNHAAKEQLGRIADQLADHAYRLLSHYRIDEAESALDALRAIAPDHPRLAGMTEDLKARRDFFPKTIAIPGGCFQMGSPASEAGREQDEHQHHVCVQSFRLAPMELSVREFKRFTQATGYKTDAEKRAGNMDGCEALEREDKKNAWAVRTWANWRKPNKYQVRRDQDPVSCVSWNDAQAYLAWLNQETKHDFRLPTEAEWEYAARAGSQTARFWGEATDKLACQYSNSADQEEGWDFGFPCNDGNEWVAPVGSFKPNAWGLYDMLGNLWEWTCSEYDADYTGAEQICAPARIDAPRVMRGGAWNSGAALVRAAYRNRNFPESRYSFVGFRLALDASAPEKHQDPPSP